MITRQFRKPYRIKKKRSILRNRFFWLGILILVIVGAIFYLLSLSEIFQIKRVIITGEKKVSKEDLKLLTEEKVENKILFLETKSIFLADLNEIKEDILNKFPQIDEIEISRGFPDTLNIIVVERLGSAIWCREDHCFLLDNKGVIFDPVRNIISYGSGETSPETDFPKIIDKQDIDPFNLGEKVIEESILASIFNIKKQLNKNFEINIKEFTIPNLGRLNVKITKDWEIYFNLKEDIDWQLTKLNLVLKEEIPPEKRGDLEYIDLRFTRVFYKYQGED